MKHVALGIIRGALMIAGFISLLGFVAGYASAFMFAMYSAASEEISTARLYSRMVLIFVIIGLFNALGSAFGWAAAMNLMKQRLKSTIAEVAFLSFVGVLDFTTSEIPMVSEPSTGFSSLWVWVFGVPIITLALPSLIFLVIRQQEFKALNENLKQSAISRNS